MQSLRKGTTITLCREHRINLFFDNSKDNYLSNSFYILPFYLMLSCFWILNALFCHWHISPFIHYMYRIKWITFKLSIATVVLFLPFICLTMHLWTCFWCSCFRFTTSRISYTPLLGQRKTKGRFLLLCRYLPSYPPPKFLLIRFPSQQTNNNH